jgi:hypothetical protein
VVFFFLVVIFIIDRAGWGRRWWQWQQQSLSWCL